MEGLELVKKDPRDREATETIDYYDLMQPADQFDEAGRTKDLVDLFN